MLKSEQDDCLANQMQKRDTPSFEVHNIRADDNSSNGEITQLIDDARSGDSAAENELCEKVFSELKSIARRLMPKDDISLQPTMLVNDLWIKFFRNNGLKKTVNRRYFYAVAADQMRNLLVDHQRRKNRLKVGGDRKRESFDLLLKGVFGNFETQENADIEALDEALERLKHHDSRMHSVVMYRFFAGLTIQQTANMMELSPSSVERDWRTARARLFADIKDARGDTNRGCS